MTETEWKACRDPHEMLTRVESGSARKLRLLACAACRRAWSQIPDERCRAELRAAEQYADGLISQSELESATFESYEAYEEFFALTRVRSDVLALYAAVATAAGDLEPWHISAIFRATADVAPFGSNEPAVQTDLLREIFGNPFRSVTFAPAWRTTDAMLLAQGIYAANAFDRMPILADALQDAGCDNDDILNHCCDASAPHARGCWVLDLILEK